MKFTYLLINLCAVIVPLLYSFHPRLLFYKYWKAFFPACILTAVIFITWDWIFTERAVWWFNKDYVTGLHVFNLPIEELLFFFCIPFSCVFTYHCLDRLYGFAWRQRIEARTCAVIAVVLLGLGIYHLDKSYTSVTFISTAILCLVLKFVFQVNWFGKALTVYSVLLLPFLIVNGLLTGTGLPAPVVIYNDAENLGIRIMTIPIEDIIYGLELFLCNLFLFQALARKLVVGDIQYQVR